jgi:hypothetical protein
MEAPHKDGEDGHHHKIEGMMMEFTVKLWYVYVMFTFLPYCSICALHVVDVLS